jgi:hypothetical protein
VRKLNVLFCNIAMQGRSGTEMFLWDLTRGLKQRGHGAGVFTPRLGRLAEALKLEGIQVCDNPRQIEWKPDLLHCQHAQETLELLAAFPTTPALYMCHDRKAWFDAPPPLRSIRRYAAVDTYCRERVVEETGCALEKVAVICNGVDLQTFQRKEIIAEQPRRALLFVSEAPHSKHVESARAACRRLRIPLDEAGGAVGNKVEDPGKLLPQYDLVFGKARCALEAMACGCAVILVGPEGLGPMIMPEGFETMRLQNFGRSLLRPVFDENLLVAEAGRYNRAAVSEVCDLTRKHCGTDLMVEAFCRLYAEVLEEAQNSPMPADLITPYLGRLAENIRMERAALELSKKRKKWWRR